MSHAPPYPAVPDIPQWACSRSWWPKTKELGILALSFTSYKANLLPCQVHNVQVHFNILNGLSLLEKMHYKMAFHYSVSVKADENVNVILSSFVMAKIKLKIGKSKFCSRASLWYISRK